MPANDEKPESKRPANTAFKQQRLKAWQPILTPKTVLPTFFVIGLLFIPIGIGLYIASDQVQQIIFDYTNCKDAPSTFTKPTDTSSSITLWKFDPPTRTCTIQFEVSKTFTPPVFIYYRLTNFFQNHRKYVKSFDYDQLAGKIVANSTGAKGLNVMCEPVRDASAVVVGTSVGVSGAQYYPCGLIANSMFSDFIGGTSPFEDEMAVQCIANTSAMPVGISACGPGLNISYKFTQIGIAWPSDGEKFAKTKWALDSPDLIKDHLVPPPEWQRVFPQWKDGYTVDNLPDLRKWERFQVWMRTAGMPNFRKLYGRNNLNPLTSGTWELSIIDNFNVTKFSGTKSIVISTVSVLGGKNPFLGVAYVVVGIICWILGIIFLVRQMLKPRKLGDHTYLSWNQPPPNAQQRGGNGDGIASPTSAQDSGMPRRGY
ncbi:hypothetical protein HK098_001007 [Nowakowskiella sp. JEL0407]|nr:hypothetical protein HK098_001007 [Nowakowskiella sp. JEL0407]